MAELLHYLDKMEYRPTPKSRGKFELKRRPESQQLTTNPDDKYQNTTHLDIIDKRPVSGFKRVIIKEFERILGKVQERKSRKEGEPRRGTTDIYVEYLQEPVEELDVPKPYKLADIEDREESMKEPKTPEDKSRELDERMEEIAEEEPVTPEDKSHELDARMKELEEEAVEKEQVQEEEPIKKKPGRKPKVTGDLVTDGLPKVTDGLPKVTDGLPKVTGDLPKPKGRRKKGDIAVQLGNIPNVIINNKTQLEGEPVLKRVSERTGVEKIIIKAPSYYMTNRKLYTQNIAKLFAKFSKELLDDKTPVSCDNRGTKDFDLLIHQRIVREYLNIYTPYRGLLLYHGLGSGKTCTSIAIAEAAKTHKRIFVMTPASLKMNFFSELKKCGDSLYKKNQFWEFIPVEGRPEYVSILSQILGLRPEIIIKNGGAWLSDIRETEPNYSDLSPEHQKSLDEQLNEMIRSKYVDINYNGLTKKKFDELVKEYGGKHSTGNPFDHSVVLVDEAHNLVSRIVNNLGKKDSISAKLYEYLQSAEDVRIVFMSGTPIINYPQEMGVLFNMLRGYIKTWKFTIPTTAGGKLSSEKILKMFHDGGLKTYDYIDYSNDTLSITRNPFGFINMDKSTGAKRAKVAVPKTRMTGGKASIKEYEEDSDSSSDSDSESESDEEQEKSKSNTKTKIKTKKNSTKKSLPKSLSKSSSRKRKPREDPVDIDPDDVIAMAPYKLNKGAVELPEDKPVDLSDAIKAQIEMEIHQEINSVGEDPYHGGTNGVDTNGVDTNGVDTNGVDTNGVDTNMTFGGAPIVDTKYTGIRLDEQGNLSDADFQRKIKEILTENDVKFLPKIEIETYKSLPDTKNEFVEIFIDIDTLTVQRPDVLKKRILGLTSYFRSAQESLLPSFVLSQVDPKDAGYMNPQFHIEYVEMSDHQFIDYAKERNTEISREPKKKKSGADENKELLKVSGSYRTFTRAKCNFAFPSEIPRPMPPGFNPEKDVREDAFDNIRDDNELDIGEVGDDEVVNAISGEYERAINKALEELKENQDRYLKGEGLMQCSPKFAKILENLRNPDNRGLHLVYTAFRTLEGVGVLKLVLEANGFAEFKLKKAGNTWIIDESANPEDAKKPKFVLYTGTETSEEKEIIRNIYNSNWNFVPATIGDKLRNINENNYYGEVIKIMMITSSGAEGINLENTRFVHIVEPYWHMVRIDQVVGRARRICSHKNLPESLRTIQVFLYMSKFSDKQKFSGENVGIMNRDTSRLRKVSKTAKMGETSITTDETLFEIAVIKDRLTKQLLKSVKESSVDCSVYDNSKEGLVCYTYGYAKSNEFGSFPNYNEDRYVREGTDVVAKKVKIDTITIKGVKYAHNTETGELYDYNAYAKEKKVVLMGRVAYVKDIPVLVN